MSSHANTSRLAKNTVALYFRMFLTLIVGLYTSREILSILGIENYGIYNVVAGVVSMCSFLNAAMAAGTQRFLAFDIGQGDTNSLKKTFNISLSLHIALAVLIFVLAEIFGRWFLNTELNISQERLSAANWTFQFALLSLVVSIVQIPFTAMIIARERMTVYAYMSFVDAGLKLLTVFFLSTIGFDKLKVYALLMFGSTVIVFLFYSIYSRLSFRECGFTRCCNFSKAKELISFAGWNLVAHVASMLSTQGINILLNIFFGPAVNAARGITIQASHALQGFVSNFQVAAAPQITKTYASGELKEEKKIILGTCKYSFFLFLLISLPIFLECEFLLGLWLDQVPVYTVTFFRLVLIDSLICTSAMPMYHAIMATGKIKRYQIVCSIGVAMSFFLSYVLFELGMRIPEIAYVLTIVVSTYLLWRRLSFLKRMIGFSISSYIKNVVKPACVVLLASSLLPTFLEYSITGDWLRFLCVSVSSFSGTIIFIWGLGFSAEERAFVIQKLASITRLRQKAK